MPSMPDASTLALSLTQKHTRSETPPTYQDLWVHRALTVRLDFIDRFLQLLGVPEMVLP